MRARRGDLGRGGAVRRRVVSSSGGRGHRDDNPLVHRSAWGRSSNFSRVGYGYGRFGVDGARSAASCWE